MVSKKSPNADWQSSHGRWRRSYSQSLADALQGKLISVEVTAPLGNKTQAEFAYIG